MPKLHGVFLTLKEIDALNKICSFLVDSPEGKPVLEDLFSYPPSQEELRKVAEKLDKKATEIDAEENGQ